MDKIKELQKICFERVIQFVEENRHKFVPHLFLSNPKVSILLQNEAALMVTILDPKSSLLPDNIRCNWGSSENIYALLIGILTFLLVRSPCKVSELNNNPFWGFRYGPKKERIIPKIVAYLIKLLRWLHALHSDQILFVTDGSLVVICVDIMGLEEQN